MNGKYVWETAKRVCDYINAHEDMIQIATFGEYRLAMRKVMMVIREAHNTEKKRRQTTQKKKSEEVTKRTQRAKALIADIKRGTMRKEEIIRRLEGIFGKGCSQEIENASSNETIFERIKEMSRTNERFETWEKMRKEFKRRQREDKRLTPSGEETNPSPYSLEEMRRFPMLRKRSPFGEVSATRKRAKDGEKI